MQENQATKPKIKKQVLKNNKKLSTILENGESFMLSPNRNKKGDILEVPSKISDQGSQNSPYQQQIQQQLKMNQNIKSNKHTQLNQLTNTNEMDKAIIAILSKDKKKKKKNNKTEQNDDDKVSRKNKVKKDLQDYKENHEKTKQKIQSKPIRKNFSFKEDEEIQGSKISLSNIPVDLNVSKIDNDKKAENIALINEYEISWNVFKFFVDKRIRWQEKLLFFVSLCLILSDIGVSIFQFYIFSNTSCFGYQSEMEFSDVTNIISSVILKICCINIIIQEITNTLPGNIQIPFLVPLSIMGVTPNLQLNQYVYSFTSCNSINPIVSYRNARTITRVLCYLFISIISLICILVMIIRIQISRQTWKRLKNIGFYVLVGGFLLSMIFIFIFISVLQIKKEFVLSLCLDNITFWIFMFICLFNTVKKIYFKKNPFPFTPSVVQQINSLAELYENKDDIETQRLKIDHSKQSKSDVMDKQENSEQNEELKEGKQKKKIVFSSQAEIKDSIQVFSVTQINQEIEKADERTSTYDNFPQAITSPNNHSNVISDDYMTQQGSYKEDNTTSSSSFKAGPKKFKFKNIQKSKIQESPIFKSVVDVIESENITIPNSKSPLSRKLNSSCSIKSNFSKDENNSVKSLGILITTSDQSTQQLPTSENDFQRLDQELYNLNSTYIKSNSQRQININNYNKSDSNENKRQKVKSLSKLQDNNDSPFDQATMYNKQLSYKASHRKNPFEVKKKSLFEREFENQNQQNKE